LEELKSLRGIPEASPGFMFVPYLGGIEIKRFGYDEGRYNSLYRTLEELKFDILGIDKGTWYGFVPYLGGIEISSLLSK